MRKTLLVVLLGMVLIACASAPPAPPTPVSPTLAPPTSAPVTVVQPLPISDEFTPTDPATVNLTSGWPHLVEFFAFW